MIVGKAIYHLLTNATGVTDVVSTRIYPEVAQQDADLPYIVYNVANNEPTDTKPEPSKLDTAQVEVNIYSTSYSECIDLAVAVRAALDRVKGTYNGVNVQSIQYLNEVIDFDEPQRAYNINADYDVRISRSGFEIAQGSPITGVQLGELSDVEVGSVTDGQVLAYDEATDTWIPANDGGALALNDLSDVDAGAPEAGQLLSYGQGDWVTIAQDELEVPISSVTGLQAALDATPDSLDDLTDVKIIGTPSEGDALVYQSGFFSLGTAGASTLGGLDDVNTTGAGVGSTITYNGSTWEISAAELPSDAIYYHNRYATEAETLRAGATETVELYYTAQADGDGLAESAESDTATTGFDIRRKLYYSEAAQADPDTGTWVQFADIADDTTFASAKATLLAYLKERTGGTVPISLKMTWEEVAEAPSFTGLLNETYGSGAAAAYSVRRLNGLYTGAAIQVERSSDNSTQDIGFDANGNLDESALTTFCTGTVCKVRTWYDQSVTGGTGSGNDAVQTTHANQPTIYTGGAIVKQDGRPILQSNSLTTGLVTTETGVNNSTFFGVIDTDPSVNKVGVLYNGGTPTHDYLFLIEDGSTSTTYTTRSGSPTHYVNGVTASFTRDSLFDFATSRSLNSAVNFDGSSYTYEFGWSTNSGIGMPSMQEAIFYPSDKSTDRTSIESNIGDYFTQNTPLLDTYTGAAAAYSLRKLRTAYTGSAIRVRRASDNAESDINFNVFGELDTVSLASFCSGTNGFVATWYDQSGNANDATQTTAANQPKIYDSVTGVVTENGKPAVEFTNDNNFNTTSITGAADAEFYTVTSVNSATEDRFILNSSSTTQWAMGAQSGSTTAVSTDFGTPTYRINGSISSISTRGDLYTAMATNSPVLSVAIGDTSNWTSYSLINRSIASNSYNLIGYLQEIVYYTSDQSANRTGIESNINTFYSIY